MFRLLKLKHDMYLTAQKSQFQCPSKTHQIIIHLCPVRKRYILFLVDLNYKLKRKIYITVHVSQNKSPKIRFFTELVFLNPGYINNVQQHVTN